MSFSEIIMPQEQEALAQIRPANLGFAHPDAL